MKNIQVEFAIQLKEIYNGSTGCCPICGAPLAHRFLSDSDHIGCADLWCTSCGESSHLSRVRFPKNVKVETLY